MIKGNVQVPTQKRKKDVKLNRENDLKAERRSYIISAVFLTFALICYIMSFAVLFVKILPNQSIGCALGFIFFMIGSDTSNNKHSKKIFLLFSVIAFAGIFLMFVPSLSHDYLFEQIYNLILYLCVGSASLISAVFTHNYKQNRLYFVIYTLIFIFVFADIAVYLNLWI